MPTEELLEIDGFDEDLAEELRNRAKEALTKIALAEEQALANIDVEEALLKLDGMNRHLAVKLAEKKIPHWKNLLNRALMI